MGKKTPRDELIHHSHEMRESPERHSQEMKVIKYVGLVAIM